MFGAGQVERAVGISEVEMNEQLPAAAGKVDKSSFPKPKQLAERC